MPFLPQNRLSEWGLCDNEVSASSLQPRPVDRRTVHEMLWCSVSHSLTVSWKSAGRCWSPYDFCWWQTQRTGASEWLRSSTWKKHAIPWDVCLTERNHEQLQHSSVRAKATVTISPDAKKQERLAFSETRATCLSLGNPFPSCVQHMDSLSSLPRSAVTPSLQHSREQKHLGPSLVSVDSIQGSTKTALERGFFSPSAARGAPRWKGTYLWLPKLAGYSPRRFTDNSFDLTLWHL